MSSMNSAPMSFADRASAVWSRGGRRGVVPLSTLVGRFDLVPCRTAESRWVNALDRVADSASLATGCRGRRVLVRLDRHATLPAHALGLARAGALAADPRSGDVGRN